MLLTVTAWGRNKYLVRSWDIETDISASGLNCLCLSREGFLWLGAFEGLIRFDGIQFTRENFPDSSPIHGNNITALWESDQGVLWIGCESGEMFSWDYHRGQLTQQPQRWPAQSVRSIAGDGRGDIWLALDTHDIVRLRDGWTLHAPPSATASGNVQHLLSTSDGRLYQQFGTVLQLQGGSKEQPYWQELQLPGVIIQRIAPSPGGQWIFANDRIRLWTGKAWGEERGKVPPGTYIIRMREASSGDLFVGTLRSGLLVFQADGSMQELDVIPGVGERIQDMIEDREGNILACSHNRLVCVSPSRVRVVSSEDNWGNSRPVSVASTPDGSWWLGTEGSGLYRIKDEQRVHLAETAGLSPFVWSLLPEGDNRLWIGTWGGGMYRYQDGAVSPDEHWNRSIQGWVVPAILRDRAGTLWAGTNTGLWHREKDEWIPVREADGSPVMQIRGMAEDREGRIWLATNGQGLKYWAAGRIHAIEPTEGIPARFISAVHCDRSGRIWVCTLGMGLYRLTGRQWSHIGYAHGLPTNDLYSLSEDQHGKFWFTSPAGIFAIAEKELIELTGGLLERLHPFILDHNDGLPSTYCSRGTQSAAWLCPDGQLLVPTSMGLAAVPTAELAASKTKVNVIFTAASIDDQVVNPVAGRTLHIPPGTRRTQFEFTSPSFSNAKRIHFRYQLLGLDNRWVDLGSRRNVLFSHLPPGDYLLRVMASNPDMVWNPIPATLALSIEPYFWETEWFRLGSLMLLVLLVGLTVWYIVRRRTRLQLEQLEAQQAIEQERRRIARDIHDELGASLTQIMMMSQVPNPVDEGVSTDATLLPRIHTVACAITKSMDELVWAVNPSHDTIESLAAYGVRIAQELVSAAGLRLRLNIPGLLPDLKLSAGLRHHLLLFLKEAINNALRHARAREISLTLMVENAQLRLEVSDDGQGFTPASAPEEGNPDRSGGHGLPNLRRRAQEMGGTLEIVSAPQRGTTLRLTVPLSSI
ncbi:MAG: ATP-binding protein [Opitutae bacterium]|nr:ATP-binding protein [Opitutae bacterium]